MPLGSARVLVLQDATFMTEQYNKTIDALRGEVVEIGSGWYLDKMTAWGLVHYLVDGDNIEQILIDTEPVEDVSEEEDTSEETPETTEEVTPTLFKRGKKNT